MNVTKDLVYLESVNWEERLFTLKDGRWGIITDTYGWDWYETDDPEFICGFVGYLKEDEWVSFYWGDELVV